MLERSITLIYVVRNTLFGFLLPKSYQYIRGLVVPLNSISYDFNVGPVNPEHELGIS